MTAALEEDMEIAVPVTTEFLDLLNDKVFLQENSFWASTLEGSGQQEMPFSTSQFAKSRPRTKP